MNDLMIDIETLGTAPGSIITSIGAVAFDAVSGAFGQTIYIQVDPISCETIGLTPDVSTVLWWMQKSDEARSSAFTGKTHIIDALVTLSAFHDAVAPIRVWAHSPSFDIVLLEAAYRKAKLAHPWGHRVSRDTRTLFDVTGITLSSAGIKHHALDDAVSQANAVCEAYEVLKSVNQLQAEATQSSDVSEAP